MDKGDILLIGGLAIVGFVAYRLVSAPAPALAVGAAPSGAASQAGLTSGNSLDKLAHDGASAALQSQGIPKPVADLAANYNFYANAKRIAPYVETGAKWIASGATSVASGAKSVVHTLSFGLL